MNKKIFILSAVALYIISTYFSFYFFSTGSISSLTQKISLPSLKYKPPVDSKGNVIIDTSAPKTEECPLSGEMLTKAHKELWEKRRPLGIMIENSIDARPQSGLTSADVVYEAVAEGGITRFIAVFYCKDSDGYVGPIRSARVYFIDMLSEYGEYPLYVHVGGANCNRTTGSGCGNGAPADALGKIVKLKWGSYNDLNFIPFPVMWRDYDRLPNRATEHTVYSTTKKLWDYAVNKRKLSNVDEEGNEWNSQFESWKFKDDEPVNPAEVTKVDFEFWQGKNEYAVTWEYNAKSNTFKRINGGQPHINKNNDKQIEAKNVAVVFMNESTARDNYTEGQHLLYKTTGDGEAIIFQDGKAQKGRWRKKDAFTRMRFYDSRGSEVALNRGQTFIEILPKGNTVAY
ncbi:hypothetical protein A3C23_00080 [Candidatus Roizmanbacteria bacterium RIFCSPHIGHO2_02_FULL_37_13b]|uniref:DUF3048 domain-containing protein n=1 Tax=Candidatus Roizmanbacteria bacterium RIFCSPLOWO2_02_FULL_36_11 TaxID=1802071 RepID=A0A1F7JHL3_9BACT|nr:MAG: hypothetical protein A3C23_00080 [Candidatus Roizmanbacteria bacterium RIFCSPHIGHO2_02_FULL_37_13b]OGK55098.1 MAG: hypothetical protein A3H78_03895 [Candidatus Roizmanbacteria bacterium RIFCSPLOWO2_02_FULL_36_11]